MHVYMHIYICTVCYVIANINNYELNKRTQVHLSQATKVAGIL